MRGLMLALMVLVGTALATGGLALGQVTPPGAELVILGSGGPRMAGRAASSNVIVLECKARILVDAGTGAAARGAIVGRGAGLGAGELRGPCRARPRPAARASLGA